MSTWFFAFSVAALIAVVILLAWRVWRLEKRADRGEYAAEQIDNVFLPPRERTASGDFLPACIPSARHVVDVRKEVQSLARALGYEWKRTDAKEGWEKREMPMSEIFAGIRWNYRSAVEMDRRKADRRKPTPQAAPKSPPKKVRRAH